MINEKTWCFSPETYALLRKKQTAEIDAWLDEHVAQETGYVLDDSLTLADAAAQAKATGDALAGKQDTLTFDDAPTDGSSNPVKSNGIYDALALKADKTDVDANEASIEYLRLREEEDRQMILGSVAEVVEDSYAELRSAPIHNSVTIGQNVYPRMDNTRLGLEKIKGRTVVDDETLVPCIVSGVEVTGFNLWDEQWIFGGYKTDDGSFYAWTDRICSKNYIPILPNASIYGNKGSANSINIFYYDADKNFLSYHSLSNVSNTSPANAYFAQITVYGITSYPDDICVNLSDPSRNGEYRPYQHESFSIPSTTLNGASTAQDYIEAVEVGENDYSLIKHTLMGSVDLGTLSFTLDSGGGYYEAAASGFKLPSDANTKGNIIHAVYENRIALGFSSTGVNGITLSAAGYLRVKTSGVGVLPSGYLAYELATPTETTIAEHLTLAEVSMLAENGGIVSIVNSNGDIVQPDLTVDTVISKAAQ